MTSAVLASLASLAAALPLALVADALTEPRGRRSAVGLTVAGLLVLALAGLLLALTGHGTLGAVATTGLVATLALISNIKRRVLGEPLLFTDLALVGAVFRHPQFYLTALRPWQGAALLACATLLLAAILMRAEPAPTLRMAGLGVMMAALLLAGALARSLACTLAAEPDADVACHGLLASLWLGWHGWRATRDHPPPPPPPPLGRADAAELVVIVQCESFADPTELFDDPTLALPGLARARAAALQHGRLLVSGFGAYTMRTEHGVLFGRDEADLGWRRYDPYLTACGEAAHALPARLAPLGWRSLFIHPHDLRFYGRDRIMSAAGFAERLGPEGFAPPAEGRYVSDAAMVDAIMARARAARGPTLIHAVTIENHGPWPLDRAGRNGRQSSAYLTLVARGDAMLARLQDELATLRRPALLVFYGDHRPSIPGAVEPGGDRHTPYVMLRLGGDDSLMPGIVRAQDCTPAQLHRAILAALAAPVSPAEADATARHAPARAAADRAAKAGQSGAE